MQAYVRGKVLGTGAFGAAVLVHSKVNGQPYVLKEVRLQGLAESDRQEAIHEAVILRSLAHCNIVRFVDSGVADAENMLWIAMEFCPDGDLCDLVERRRRRSDYFSEEQALGMFVQVALALRYLHAQHILHRDLKSKNVFLSGTRAVKSHACPVIKLGDFGISKLLESTMACARTQIGTPYYLSPEICLDQPYNIKSDVWATGCLFFEMLALRVCGCRIDCAQPVAVKKICRYRLTQKISEH